MEIRKIIYTTNTIESLNSSIRKYTKTKTVFPDDQSAMKAVHLAINNIHTEMDYAYPFLGNNYKSVHYKFEDRCQI